jgi:hypothetical protein
MLFRVTLLSLLLGACAPAVLSPVTAATGVSTTPMAAPDASSRPARVRRVARLAPPFGAQAAARRVSAPEHESLPALAVTR